MKYFLLLVTFIQCSFFSLTQWHRIRTMDKTDYYNYNYQEIISPSPEKIFYSAITKLTNSSPENNIVCYSLNGGVSWDSLNFFKQGIGTLKYLNESFIYIVTAELIYPLSPAIPYSKKYLHLSEDGGQTWAERLIDSTSNGMGTNALTFFNDSVAIIREKIGCCITQNYQTNDKGLTWYPVEYPDYEQTTPYNGSGIYLGGQYIGTYNLEQQTYIQEDYTCFGEGSISGFDVNGTKLIRTISGQDGPEQGYPSNNYLILSIHDQELANQKVLHFPYVGTTSEVCYNGSQIILIGGVSLCSRDDGDSFFYQEIDDPEDLFISLADFSNENVGYALSRNLESNIWQVLKTTNGGGTTDNYLPAPILKLASIEQLEEDGFSVYPNPTSDELTISSIENIIQISLFQLDGKLVESEIEVGLHFKMNLSNLKTGTYFIELTTDKGSIRKKINKI